MAQMERPHRFGDRDTSKVQVHQFPTVEQFLRGEASNWSPPTATTTASILVRDHHHELEDDHAHHQKKSVLTKVKEKAKKLRHSLSTKKKHNESVSSTPSWSVHFNEDEDEEDDVEYLGAPMHEPELAPEEGNKRAKHQYPREIHTILESHFSPKTAKDNEKPLSPIKKTITETSPRDKTITEASPRNKSLTETSLRNKTLTETSPRNKTITETSPTNKSTLTETSPRNKSTLTETSPRNKSTLTETSPRNKSTLTETSPRNKSTLTETSPRNKSTLTETSPRNKSTLTETSPRNKSTLTETSPRNKTLTETSPRNKTMTETFTDNKSVPIYNTVSDEKLGQAAYNTVSEKSGPTPNIESEEFGQPTYNTEPERFGQPTYNTVSEKLAPAYNTLSEKLAPAYASVSDATRALASKLQGLSISTNNDNPTQPNFTPALRSFSTREVREPLTPPTSPKSYSSPLPAQFGKPSITSTEHIWDKGVSVREYLMHKFEPGEDEKALSQVISEAISPKKSPSDYGVVDKVREAVTSLLRNDDPYKTTSSDTHSTANISSPHLPVSTNAHEVAAIEEENHGRILQEN